MVSSPGIENPSLEHLTIFVNDGRIKLGLTGMDLQPLRNTKSTIQFRTKEMKTQLPSPTLCWSFRRVLLAALIHQCDPSQWRFSSEKALPHHGGLPGMRNGGLNYAFLKTKESFHTRSLMISRNLGRLGS